VAEGERADLELDGRGVEQRSDRLRRARGDVEALQATRPEVGQQALDRVAERLDLLLLDPEDGGLAALIAQDDAEGPLAGPTDRLGLQPVDRREVVAYVVHALPCWSNLGIAVGCEMRAAG